MGKTLVAPERMTIIDLQAEDIVSLGFHYSAPQLQWPEFVKETLTILNTATDEELTCKAFTTKIYDANAPAARLVIMACQKRGLILDHES